MAFAAAALLVPLANGRAMATFDAGANKLAGFWPRPFYVRGAGDPTPQLAYDAFFGAIAPDGHGWLSERAVEEAAYIPGTGVFRARGRIGSLELTTHVFAPVSADAPALVLAVRARGPVPAEVYASLNFHLGEDGAQETIAYRAADDAWIESGSRGALVYWALAPSARHPRSPENPYAAVREGRAPASVEGEATLDDAVAGFSWSYPGGGAERWYGVLIAPAGAAVPERDAAAWVQAEVEEWARWQSRARLPAGLSDDERAVARQSLAVIRMAQARGPDGPGQILASLPPGAWAITWPRDQSYAGAALARAGYTDEARAAVRFVLEGSAGEYASYLGVPDYAVSVARYYGTGLEESDSNEDGPNIELDGWGLFLWQLAEAGDETLRNHAAARLNKQRLKDLIGTDGLLPADSSIWEVHWNGKQRRFAYSQIAAAAGLCAAGEVTEARRVAQAIRAHLLDSDGAVVGSVEDRNADAAVIEAFNFGVFPVEEIAPTLARLESLRLPSGGYRRNDRGGWYDRQEWAFIDLRIAAALYRSGRTAAADALVARVTASARATFDLIPELYDEATGDPAGAFPMVGFGAGAYLLALGARGRALDVAACPAPGGPDGGVADAGTVADADADSGIDGGSPGGDAGGGVPRGCSCSGGGAWLAPLGALALRGRPRRTAARGGTIRP